MITTTLNRIRAHEPCTDGWQKLLAGLGKTAPDNEPLPFARIVAINGLDDALWCCRAEPQYDREWRLYAVWCARQVQHLLTDPRSLAALDVAERYANGEATREELLLARAAAWDVAWAAWDAARDAAWAARDARAAGAAGAAAWAARDARAARAAAGAAARADARADAWAARDARAAAGAAPAGLVDYEAALAAQKAEFLRVVTETEGRS